MHSARHHDPQRCPLSSAASRLAGDRPVPHIVTELPGPKARAHVAFDEDVDLPQPAPRLPDRAGPRRGPDGRGHRRQPLPRLRGRHRRQLDRPRAPAGRRPRSRSRPPSCIHFCAPTSTCRSTPQSAAGSREIAPIDGQGAGLPRQLGHGGGRGGDQARALRHASASTSSRSSAPSTAGPTARSR